MTKPISQKLREEYMRTVGTWTFEEFLISEIERLRYDLEMAHGPSGPPVEPTWPPRYCEKHQLWPCPECGVPARTCGDV